MDFTPHWVESVAAPARTAPVGRSLGALLLDLGKIRPSDAELILRMQKERNLRFGEAAIRLGLVTESDIQQALSRQYEFPYLMPGQNLVAPELIAAHQPFSPEVESLRALRTQLMLRWFGAEPRQKTLAVVSTERGDGRSYLAANLAEIGRAHV